MCIPPSTKIVNPYLFYFPVSSTEMEPGVFVFNGFVEVILSPESKIHKVFEQSTLSSFENIVPVHEDIHTEGFFDLLWNGLAEIVLHEESDYRGIGFVGHRPISNWLPRALVPEVGVVVLLVWVEGNTCRVTGPIAYREFGHDVVDHPLNVFLGHLNLVTQSVEEGFLRVPCDIVISGYIK